MFRRDSANHKISIVQSFYLSTILTYKSWFLASDEVLKSKPEELKKYEVGFSKEEPSLQREEI